MPVDITSTSLRFRQHDPVKYKSFATKPAKGADGISFVYGVKDDGKTEVQSVIFDKKKHSMAGAKKWLKDNGMGLGEALKDAGSWENSFGLSEAVLDGEKREIVITALKEGAGNQRDKRWYTAEAVKGCDAVFRARRKLFYNHLSEGESFDKQNLRDWCATMLDTYVVEEEGKQVRKVRLKIHDDWLWERCKTAPEEIALSIEGRGAGHVGNIGGEEYTIIEKVYHLNATKFVPYPGNATMGADLVEGEGDGGVTPEQPEHLTTEESEMEMKDLTSAMLKEQRADLVAELVTEAAKADGAKDLRESFRAEMETLKGSMTKTIEALNASLNEAKAKLDGYEVKDRLTAKKALLDRVLAESKLPAEAQTPILIEQLYGLSDKSAKGADGKDIVVTVEEQAKAICADRLSIIAPRVAAVTDSGASKPAAPAEGALTEEERHVVFQHNVLGTGPSLAEFRKAKAEKK